RSDHQGQGHVRASGPCGAGGAPASRAWPRSPCGHARVRAGRDDALRRARGRRRRTYRRGCRDPAVGHQAQGPGEPAQAGKLAQRRQGDRRRAADRVSEHRPADHPPVAAGRIGVLLVNLGTPEATDYWSMRRYLSEFLSDPRVIEENRIKWWLVLNLIILSVRPRLRGRDYERIWNRERNESPLKTITRAQAEKLGAALAAHVPRIIVDWAMRYGNPSIAAGLNSLRERGCERILLMPLYPQYAAATTATVCDKAFETLATMRWQPAIRVLPPYYDDPVYIDAVA